MLAVFPDGSVYVYVTGVVPTGKKDPGELVLCCSVAVPELSVTVGSVHDTVVPSVPKGMTRVMSSNGEMTGAMVSTENINHK